MIAAGPSKEKLTIQECISRLETFFRAYQKDSEFNYQLSVSDSPFNQLREHVSKLKNIEEWLGVDLETLFKALKDGIYTPEGFVGYVELSLLSDIWYLTNEEKGLALPVETYGQFWALTKEKLEARNYRPIISIDKNLYGDGIDWYRATFREFPSMIGGIGLTEDAAIEKGYEMLEAEIKFRKEEGLDIPEPKEELK